MPRPLSDLPEYYTKALLAMEQNLAEQFAYAALPVAVGATVGPEISKTSTGRHRESLKIENGRAKGYDPGKKVMHSIPDAKDAEPAMKRRKPGQMVSLSSGVPYVQFVEKRYQPLQTGLKVGVQLLDVGIAAKKARRALRG